MDSHKFLGGSKGGGYSKAQMCLQKILGIICSIPPPPNQQISKASSSFYHHNNLLQLDSSSSSNKADQPPDRRGFIIDLNSELTSSPQAENNSLAIDQDDSSSQDEKTNPVSETRVEDIQKRETEPFCSRKEEEGALALLTDTGEELSSTNGLSSELVTKEINDKESVKMKGKAKRGVLYLHDGDVSRAVRTKRGRLRVLPCRYKDSVLQPLARTAVPRKRQRLS